MRLDIYLKETQQLAEVNGDVLEEVRQRLLKGEKLSRLEQSGVLHVLQVLIENAIGKAKHTLKHHKKTVPISAYDVFEMLGEHKVISVDERSQWSAIIGLRNKIVYDCMNIDPEIVLQLIKNKQHQLVIHFLMAPIGDTGPDSA